MVIVSLYFTVIVYVPACVLLNADESTVYSVIFISLVVSSEYVAVTFIPSLVKSEPTPL